MQRQATQRAFKALYTLQVKQSLRTASTSNYASWPQNASMHEDYVQMERRQKRKLSAEVTSQMQPLTEDDLLHFYTELMTPAEPRKSLRDEALPGPSMSIEQQLEALSQRLLAPGEEAHEAPEQQDTESLSFSKEEQDFWQAEDEYSSYRATLDQLEENVKAAESVAPITSLAIPLSVATSSEWNALATAAIASDSKEDLSRVLQLMQRAGTPIRLAGIHVLLRACKEHANPMLATSLLNYAESADLEVSADTHHLVIRSYLKAGELTGAQRHLRQMEEASLVPSLASYNSIISTLFRSSSQFPQNRSTAWDLYSHMRLVSYPTPDRLMYNTMIYACASGPSPSPERAQDLFQELLSLSTTDPDYSPDADTYTAFIRSCTRTRRRGESYYTQGLEYLKRMIDEGLTPSRETLHSIMEGSKRIGDLARARWIFLKLEKEVNEYSVSLLWQTYATYKAPSGKGKKALKVQEGESSSAKGHQDVKKDLSEVEEAEERELTWPGPMPQSSKEIVLQIRRLTDKLIAQWKGEAAENDLFANVKSSTYLLNSYLIALNAHAPFSDNISTYQTIFKDTAVPKDGHSYKIMMQACERPSNKSAGLTAAQTIFAEWQAWRKEEDSDTETQAVWTSFIRTLARNKLSEQALDSALAFHAANPPSALVTAAEETVAERHKTPKAGIQLANESYPETSAPARNPPRLVFEDLASLHKLLKDTEDKRGLAKLTGLFREYDDARKRADVIGRQGLVERKSKESQSQKE